MVQTMATDCPDNSTECLLRALIATTATQVSPWEPRSFGFTVAIGVAAFLISFVAIFQGLLAAGPGRIKASSDAIGNFSKYSKGYISWREFAWRSKAFAPTITFQDLLRNLPKQHQKVEYGTAFYDRLDGASTGASWLALLKCIGLDEDIEALFEERLQPCSTDHLPADVQAPPAAIQMSALAVLAAIADPSTTIGKGSSDRFPVVTGDVSQLSFREHPVLGTLAAYERYHTQTPREHKPFGNIPIAPPYASIGRCTRLALDMAEGSLLLHWPLMPGWNRERPIYFLEARRPIYDRAHRFDPDKPPQLSGEDKSVARVLAAALMYAQTDYEHRPFPWKTVNLSESVFLLGDCLPRRYQQVETAVAELCLKTCGFAYSSKDSSEESAIAFKARGSWVVPFEGEKLQRGLSSVTDLAGSITKTVATLLKGLQPDPLRSPEDPKDRILTDVTSYSWENLPDACFCLEHVDIFLAWHREKAIEALNRVTDRLEVDSNHDAPNVLRAKPPGPAAHNGSEQNSVAQSPTPISTNTIPTRNKPNPGSSQETHSSQSSMDSGGTPQTSATDIVAPESETEAFEALVIFRGLLFAACLAFGPDTSLLWSGEFKNSFVRVI